ncbi:MAG: HAMP domain-containing sensor histidine kinase [Thermaerobacter sp.]|nr:HAMP domain-containing sensor histidine kinase [Thermaerobacter sp.]
MRPLRRLVWSAILGVGVLTVLGTVIGAVLILRPGGPGSLFWARFALLAGITTVAAGSAVLLAGWVAIQGVSRWSEQLTRLRDFTRQVGRGDTPSDLVVSASDDWGELAYALRQMAQDLQAAAAQRETFLAAVAHDLRTPLAALIAQVEGMLSGVVPVDAGRLGALQTDLSRLHRLVEDVLLLAGATLGRTPATRHEPVDVGQLLRRVAARFAPLAEVSGMALTVQAGSGLIGVVDPDRIDTVLGNLLHNAIRYGDVGREIVVGVAAERHQLVIHVANHGPDIPPSQLRHLTEPFVDRDPARRRHGGNGLGLAIAQFWVRQHGGELTLRSAGGLTIATVTLPRFSGPTGEEPRAPKGPNLSVS